MTTSLADSLHSLGLFVGADITADAAPTMASPSWWGADSECFDVRTGDASHSPATVFVKKMIGHADAYVDVAHAFAAATEAGERGVGPRVHASDAAAGTLVLENLVDSASTATLNVFDDDARLEELIALRAQVHGFGSITRTATVFDDLRTLSALAVAKGVALPADFDWMARMLAMAEQRIVTTDFDTVPCHGDGNVSNVLLVDDGRLLLLDWDVAAVMDPLQDIGVLLAEVRPFDSTARQAFEIAWGRFDQSLFDRARVYGIADCVRWGLIGAYADSARPGTLEYSKLSDWQFLRARAGLGDVHFYDRLANL
ncbi:phosphotransferase [Mycobacterium yunnanensis]|uniref:Phosphotransferase n=1 Tax=Mycobacterium yunnanensis TaxID=368477 RepID=A0A9X3BTD3_9MYCO|nr:aminoglycoside phosphotransferase family protein [Mycobacterium yunnanensis]MCV7421010.1 phosphotransferase [Mycobacterium yunnanensis]